MNTRNLLIIAFVFCFAPNLHGHDGPDPVAHWIFNSRHAQENQLVPRLGPIATIQGKYEFVDDPHGQSLRISGFDAEVLLAEDFRNANVMNAMPRRAFTVAAWFSIDQRKDWGAVIGALQDNGDFEKGWLLGYNRKHFYFGLSSTGADDGDGLLTYMESDTEYETGRLYFLVAVYDGQKMELYVDGHLAATSQAQSGDILYPASAPFVIGTYRDDNETYPHVGRIRDIAIYHQAAKPKWVREQYEMNEKLTALQFADGAQQLQTHFVVQPYLQFVTQTEITVMWQTSRPAVGTVEYGQTVALDQKPIADNQPTSIHELKLVNLEPNTQYFYRARAIGDDDQQVESEIYTFQTAPDRETPYAFAIISDTQSNPKVANQIAKLAWGQRPSFLIHPGDLVGTGTADDHWTQQFFPSMQPLISRVPYFPVLGNHELNASNYYDYMSLPAPEYYYQFSYGNADFFMIDSNRKVDADSEQFQWLDKALAASSAQWKFVVHHHPPYSSDENDYGNLWKSNQSTRGDPRMRSLTKLYDQHHVDIVWNGHIHSYERTWPLLNGNIAKQGGTIYMVTGGGGGGLETPGPFRPFFQNNVKRGHHYCMAYVNRNVLEFKAFDLQGRLFDYLKIVRTDR